jgi:3-hydroxybutyryl-CoA dehydratase
MEAGFQFPPVRLLVTRELIRGFAEASHDFNPLHLDDAWMGEAEFGPTRYGQVIAHGLLTYSLVTRMLTDFVYPAGGWHERCEMRFLAPVFAGDELTATGRVTAVREMGEELLYVADVEAHKQDGTVVARGDAMGRVPAPDDGGPKRSL